MLRIADYDGIEQKVRERIKNKLLSESPLTVAARKPVPQLR